MRIRWRYIRRTVGVVLLLMLVGAVVYGVVHTVADSRQSGSGASSGPWPSVEVSPPLPVALPAAPSHLTAV